MKNLGGCQCKDCNNGQFSTRAYDKRLWQQEVEDSTEIVPADE